MFGVNFNGLPIPQGWARRFRKSLRLNGKTFRLAGVALNSTARDAMLIQATNGTRLLHVEKRHAASGDVFGIYVY
jgi:hypothetical protein